MSIFSPRHPSRGFSLWTAEPQKDELQPQIADRGLVKVTPVRTITVGSHFTARFTPSILEKIFMESSSSTRGGSNPTSSFIYGLGFIGALIYFLQAATSFWIGVLAFFKAVFWPAFMVYYILDFLKK